MTNPLFVLAPMDGMTHASFRTICFDYGADGATTEMILSLAYGRAKRKLSDKYGETLIRMPGEGDLAAQLIGARPDMMAASARKLTALRRFNAIEINMGCPARVVVGSGNGSALLKDPALAIEVMRAVRENTDLPVRLKLRLGWDARHIVAAELAGAAEELGFERVTLHGRTREQMYAGEVDVEAIRRVVGAMRVPVFANGGVTCAEDALTFLKSTGAAGVAIGRAALKQPWIFDDIRRLRSGQPVPERSAAERVALLVNLAARACTHRPERVAIREMRKFSGWMLPGLTGAEDVLRAMNHVEYLQDFKRLLEDYLDRLERADDLHVHPELLPRNTLDTVRQGVRTPARNTPAP